MKIIIGVLSMLLPLLSGAQSPPVKALTIGDTVPDITVTNVYNYPSSTIHFNKLETKLVVFDFMSTGCKSCIEALPRFDSLQKKYKNELQIFLVIPESEERIKSFLQRKNIAGLILPVIIDDTILSQIFPHTYIPHDVLIKDGIVKAITFPEYIVAENIGTILNGKKIGLPVKRDINEFQYNEPLLHLNESMIPDFSYPATTGYGTVTSYLNNVPKGFTTIKDTIKNMLRISMINAPIVELYIRALHRPQLRPAFILLELTDTNRYAYKMGTSLSQEWMRKNSYCYEGLFPLNYSESEIGKKIAGDLDFYLGLQGKMEKREMPCIVINRDTNSPHTPKKAVDYKRRQSISLRSIVRALNGNYGNIPFIDETGVPEIVFYGLNKDEYTDISKLTKVFKENGLQIKRCDRAIDLLVIKENLSANLLSTKTN